SSPCRGAGNAAYASGLDIDGEPWASPPSMGCDELYPGAATGELSIAIQANCTNVATKFPAHFAALITGRTTASWWDFGDGTVVSNRPFLTHSWMVPGDYQVVLSAANDSAPGGVTAVTAVHVVEPPTHFVSATSANSIPPYSSWATAAATIQDAIDAASVCGATVLVTDGVYATGGRPVTGGLSNRVAITKPLTLQSVNGAEATIIQGYKVPGRTNGDFAVRCVYLAADAALRGFTLT